MLQKEYFENFIVQQTLFKMTKSTSMQIFRLHHISFLGKECYSGQEIVNRMLYYEEKEWDCVVVNRSVEIKRKWKENG